MTVGTPSDSRDITNRSASNEIVHCTGAATRCPLTVSKQTALSKVVALMSHDRQTCDLNCALPANNPTHRPPENSSYQDSPEFPPLVLSCAVILDNGKPIGIVTERDLVRLAARGTVIAEQTVETVMTSPLIAINQTQANDLFAAVNLLKQHRIRHLPIVDHDDRLVGIVTREGLRQSPQISNLLRLHQAVDTMTGDVIQAPPTATLQSIAQLMSQHQVSCIVITETIENQTFPIGIITEGDIVQSQALLLDFSDLPAQSVMSHPAFCTSPNLNLWQAHQLMAERRITHLVITHGDGSLAGILTQTTILKVLNLEKMVDVISMLQQQVKCLETEKLQLLESHNTERPQAAHCELGTYQQTELCFYESDQHYVSLAAIIPVIIFQTDIFGACIYINEYWTELTGISRQETLGQGWVQGIYPEDRLNVLTTWQQAVQMGQSWQQEFRLQLSDGLVKWVYGQAQPKCCMAGKVSSYVGSLIDVSDRKQAELDLRESEQRFRRAIADAPVPIMIHAEDGEVLQINSTWTELTGYTHTDIPTTQAWIERAYSEQAASVMGNIVSQQYSLKSRLEEGDFTITTHDGQQRIWNFSSASLGNLPDGRRIAIAMAADITEKQQAQAALQASENRYRALVEVIPDLMIRQDAEGNYLDLVMSDEVRFIQPDLAYSGVNIYDLLPLELAQQRMVYVYQALETGEVQIYEFEIDIGGELRWQEARIIAINPTEVLVIVRDISKRKLAEQKQYQTEASLRQIVEGTAAVTEHDFFQELVQHITAALDVRYAGISEATSDGFEILAFCADGHLQTIDAYPDEQFPCCIQALQQGQYHQPDSLLSVYPESELYSSLNAESYLGIALRNSAGTSIGNLCIMHDRPLRNHQWMINLLKIFGARAGAELERYQTARQLQILTSELEQRVADRTTTLAKTVEHLQTEIKRRQALADLLLKSQDQLQDIFDSANDMIQSVSLADGSFEFVNRSWLETLGYTAQDLEHITILDVLHPDYQEHYLTLIQQLKTGQLQKLEQVEISFVTKNGHVIEVEGNVNCRIVDHQTVYTRGIFRNISERKRNEAQLYNLSTRLSLAVKSGGLGIWEWDLINEQLAWDSRMCELYGIPPEEFTGHFTDWSNRVHPNDLAEAQAKFEKAIQEQKEMDIEFRVIHPNGQVRHIKANGLVQPNNKGEHQRVIGINMDISDRKKVEIEIIKSLERERELNEMKSRFVSNTSHEFRTPLTVISNNAELLKLFGNKLNETEQQQCLDTILNYVDHMTELIDEVLVVSKAESYQIQLKTTPLDVVEFSQQLGQTISLSSPKHHVEFVVQDARSHLQKHSYYAPVDSKILQQSLTNLLTNAIKYSPEGSKIIFQLELLPDTIQFRVIDKGIGIPKEDQKYLFEPFHRATNVGTRPGTGLGLSIVKHLVNIHQGKINVQSTLGQGSCFTITIPSQWQELDSCHR
ncbi:PAS domain S-box protein [Leptothoe sp. LEGE 181152]|nr:PAS domain S-box protein [Leptothoe sp. LEGE 181152]